jgi:hypothetical protein
LESQVKISRRGLFGLSAGAAAAPFVKPVEAEASAPKWVQYGGYTDADGVLRVGVIPDEVVTFRANGKCVCFIDARGYPHTRD